MDPEPVSGHEVGDLTDRQGNRSALDMHVYLWTGQVKGGIGGV
jgi:hypothetical protein